MIEVYENSIILTESDAFSPEQTFLCGQCFRFDPCEGGFSGIAGGRFIRAEELNGKTVLHTSKKDFEDFWRDYFDLGRDYSAVRGLIADDPFLVAAEEYGRGIRMLRQEPWEALCSFIISQCNNIPRIKGIVNKLCCLYGREIDGGFAFPDAETIAELTAADLAPIRAGYRAEYIVSAAREVASGTLDLEALKKMPTAEARKRLLAVHGVGKKVADCVLLFGLSKTDSFPVDVWIKRVLDNVYPDGFDAGAYGDLAGIVQQYLFFYARDHGELFGEGK